MSSNLAPTLGLLDPLTGPFLSLHGFLSPADDLDLVVEDGLHLLVGFDFSFMICRKSTRISVITLAIAHKLKVFRTPLMDSLSLPSLQSCIAMNLEEHHLGDRENVGFVQRHYHPFLHGLAVEVLENEAHHHVVLFDRFPLDLSLDVLQHQEGREDLLEEFLHKKIDALGPVPIQVEEVEVGCLLIHPEHLGALWSWSLWIPAAGC